MNRRIDLAIELPGFCSMYRTEIMLQYCPADVFDRSRTNTLCNVDLDPITYKGGATFDTCGCRGITCQQCWEKIYLEE